MVNKLNKSVAIPKKKKRTKIRNKDFDYLGTSKPIAILIDGGFFLRRYKHCFKVNPPFDPKQVAKDMYTVAMAHADNAWLYRIFYYDCPPIDKKTLNPVSGRSIDFYKTNQANFRREFFTELKKLRKVALRMGYLKENNSWVISPRKTKELLGGRCQISDLQEHDIAYDVRQKGVDMKIGIDIASLAYKQQVGRIVLISGDADFVPAAKLARREGIDFILDPMWNNINSDLHEHIDGLKSTSPRPDAGH